MDTPQTLEKKYRLQKWHIVLLVILGLCCSMILRGIYHDIQREHIRKDFLQTVADIYTDVPGTLQPNYIADGWCYFLVEEEHAVYRIAEGAETPELVISNASGCITVTEDGVLFLRPTNRYMFDGTLWRVQYDLMRWRDGVETMLWEDCDIHGQDGDMTVVGDFLVYCGGFFSHSMRYRPLDETGVGPENRVFKTKDSFHLRDILWLDEAALWYARTTDPDTVKQLIGEDYYIFGVKDVVRLDLSTGTRETVPLHIKLPHNRKPYGITRRLFGVNGGKLYYQQLDSGNLFAYDFAEGTSEQVLQRVTEQYPDHEISFYRASTGECYVSILKDRTAVQLKMDTLESYPQKDQVQTVFGSYVIRYADRYDTSNYEVYHGMAVYDANNRLWGSNGTFYTYYD